MINWKVRIRNKAFWLALIPAVLLLVQGIGEILGFTLTLDPLGNRLLAVTNEIFALLSILGIVNDPTTKGFSDSETALTYEHPKA